MTTRSEQATSIQPCNMFKFYSESQTVSLLTANNYQQETSLSMTPRSVPFGFTSLTDTAELANFTTESSQP